MGRGPSAVAAAALFNSCSALHMSINSPSMLLAAAFPCWLWAEELPSNQAGTSTCGTLTVVALGQASLLPAGPKGLRLPCPGCLWLTAPPPKTPSGDGTFPFIALRGSPGEWRHYYVLGSPARCHPGALVPLCPCGPC